MVEVIGQDDSQTKKVTCSSHAYRVGCGAILRYRKTDIKEYHGTDYSGGSDGREWIVCPQCGQDITLRNW